MRKRIVSFLLISVTTFGFVSCHKDELPAEPSEYFVEGTWEVVEIWSSDGYLLNSSYGIGLGDIFKFTHDRKLTFDVTALSGIQADGNWDLSTYTSTDPNDTLFYNMSVLELTGNMNYISSNYSRSFVWKNLLEESYTSGTWLSFYWNSEQFYLKKL
ncbi:MAG: hypothetical protein FD123_940 [Bacteroidetes bacterium]|nr:MAG: hypothetical protein FD123_940 [Bacteroidota bacterium]